MNVIGVLAKRMARAAVPVIVGFGAFGTISPPAHATYLIDPNFFVCADATADQCGNHPNIIDETNGSFNASVIGGAGTGPLDPFLLLFAIPNFDGTAEAGPVNLQSTGGATVSPAESSQYGGNFGTDGYLGEYTGANISCPNNGGSNKGTDLYCFANLVDGNSSLTFVNFNIANNFIGLFPTSYSIYEFVVDFGTGTNLGTSDVYNFTYDSLPQGTVVGAWGIEKYPAENGTHVYDSAMTVAGFVSSSGGGPPSGFIPEPGTLALLGLGLSALGFRYRKQLRAS